MKSVFKTARGGRRRRLRRAGVGPGHVLRARRLRRAASSPPTSHVGNFERFGFNDSASSVIVRGGWWELCEDARFSGSCVTLRPGSYGSLAAMGLNNRVSSVRPAQAQ